MSFARFCCIVMGLLACLDTGAVPTSQPINYREELRQNPPQHVHIVSIDLGDPRISLHVARGGETDPDGDGPWQCTLAPTSMVARRENYAVAINANFFDVKETREILGRKIPYFYGNWAKSIGWTVSKGQTISGEPWPGALVVDAKAEVQLGRFGKPLPQVKEAVSGGLLVVDGKVNPAITPDAPAPRTGVGLDRDRKMLYMIVVDGRRIEYSAGMSVKEFADEFVKLNCDIAVNLDGGGSSTMVMRDKTGRTWSIMNRPSDGNGLPGDPSLERSVAVILGVKYDDAE